jgi:hypothetical protein
VNGYPAETERKLLARASATGKDVATLVREAVEEKLRALLPPFAEVLAPVHEDFRKSGMTEAEVGHLLERTLAEARKERDTSSTSLVSHVPSGTSS